MQHHSVTSVSPSNKVQNLRVVLKIPKLVSEVRVALRSLKLYTYILSTISKTNKPLEAIEMSSNRKLVKFWYIHSLEHYCH